MKLTALLSLSVHSLFIPHPPHLLINKIFLVLHVINITSNVYLYQVDLHKTCIHVLYFYGIIQEPKLYKNQNLAPQSITENPM